MSLKLIGKKKGMTQVFDSRGRTVPCSVIHAEPNCVIQIKKEEKDGYHAIQLGAVGCKKATKPQKGHFLKAKGNFYRHLSESRIDATEEYELGQEISCDYFKEGEFVDITSISKGKGFQGVMKKFGFAGGPGAHGSGFHRHAGSTGMRSTPGRCFPGGKRASRLGYDRVTVQNLEIVHVDAEKKIIVVKGSIPGHKGSIVTISKAIKKSKKA